MYAQLGDIVFEGLKGLTGLRTRKTSSLAQHAVIDGKPKLQKTGDNLDEVSLEMTFHSSFCTPETEISRLDSAISNGEILPLITGTGEALGNFVIAERSNSVQHTFKDGAIILARVSVTLIESASTDVLGSAIAAAKATAFSNGGNNPNTVPFTTSVQSMGLKATNALGSASSFQSSGTQNLTLANASAPVQANELRKAKKAFEGVNKSIEDFEGAFSQVQSVIANAEQIEAAAKVAKTYTQNILTAIEDGDVTSAVSSNRDLRNGLGNLGLLSSELVTLTAIRRI